MKLVQFNLELYRAPNIFTLYLLPDEKADNLVKRLKESPSRVVYCGEMEGKHSDTKFTCEELEKGMRISDDPEKVASFLTLFSETANSRYTVDCKWVGSSDIISHIEDSWQEEVI